MVATRALAPPTVEVAARAVAVVLAPPRGAEVLAREWLALAQKIAEPKS